MGVDVGYAGPFGGVPFGEVGLESGACGEAGIGEEILRFKKSYATLTN